MIRILAPRTVLVTAFLTLALWHAGALPRQPKARTRSRPQAALDAPAGQATSDVAVLAGGCFWACRACFSTFNGVTNAVSGYAGERPEVGDL